MPGLADLLPSLLTSAGGAPGSAMKGAVPPPGPGVESGLPPLLPPGGPLPPGMPSPFAAGPGQFPPSTPIPEGGASMTPAAPAPSPGGSLPGATDAQGQGMPSASALPPPPQYATETQADGTILLRMKNPDGSMGPAVKIVRAPKRALNAEHSAAQVK